MTDWAPKHKIEEVLSIKIYDEIRRYEKDHQSPYAMPGDARISCSLLRHWFALAERYNLVLAEMMAHIREQDRVISDNTARRISNG